MGTLCGPIIVCLSCVVALTFGAVVYTWSLHIAVYSKRT